MGPEDFGYMVLLGLLLAVLYWNRKGNPADEPDRPKAYQSENEFIPQEKPRPSEIDLSDAEDEPVG